MRISKTFCNGLSLLECIFCVFIVLSSGSLFATDYSYTLYVLIFVFLVMYLNKELRITYNVVPVFSWLLCFTFLSIIQNVIYSEGEGFDVVLKNYLIIFCVFCFALSKPNSNKIRIAFIVKVIIVISIISNVLYLYNLFGPGLPLTESNTSHTPHFHYLFSSGINTIGIGFDVRNGGIYWEPGMYQVFLTFSLLYYLYNKGLRKRVLVIIYLTATAISTFSVSAYTVLIFLYGLYSIRNGSKVIIKLLFILLVSIVFYYLYPFVKESMEIKETTGSYDARSNDFFLGFNVFLQHPLFGCGIVNYEYAKESYKVLKEVRFNSNGMMNLLISFGLVGSSIVAFYIISLGKWIKNSYSKYMLFGFYAWILISCNTESIVFHPFFEFLIGIGISYSMSTKYTTRPFGWGLSR